MLCTVNDEIGQTQAVVDCKCSSDNYNSIYFHSNESLNSIFDCVDVSGKECLTVLASGDQAFHLYNRGAKNVEMFDINRLTIYYYYLRVWTIMYLGNYYPDEYIDKNFLTRLLKLVKPKNKEEQFVYDYWKKFSWYFEDYDCEEMEELFITGTNMKKNQIDDLSVLQERLKNEVYIFHNIDITLENVDLRKKYDIVFVSNISDYIHSLYRINVYRNNLSNLIKDDGKIIATCVTRTKRSNDEISSFDYKFNVEFLKEEFNDFSYRSPGYVYTKKRVNKK